MAKLVIKPDDNYLVKALVQIHGLLTEMDERMKICEEAVKITILQQQRIKELEAEIELLKNK